MVSATKNAARATSDGPALLDVFPAHAQGAPRRMAPIVVATKVPANMTAAAAAIWLAGPPAAKSVAAPYVAAGEPNPSVSVVVMAEPLSCALQCRRRRTHAELSLQQSHVGEDADWAQTEASALCE